MRSCWLCGKNGARDPLDKHHIFGGAYRNKSEKYGLTVDLCHCSCHLFGKEAAHNCRDTMDELHRYGQKLAMQRYGWTKEEFMLEFGKNYLDEDELEQLATASKMETVAEASRFVILDEELCVNW